MSENQIIVNSIEELISKAEEFVVSQGGTGSTKITHSYSNSGEYTWTKNGPVKKNKSRIGIGLKGKKGGKVEYILEGKEAGEQDKFSVKVFPELLSKVISELEKINISYASLSPNQEPSDNHQTKPPKTQSFSILAIPCSSLQEVKDRIKEYYQKNSAEIRKNPDFHQWVQVTYSSFGHQTKYSKEGEETSNGHFHETTFSLKEYEEKGTNTKIDLMLKVARDENDFNFSFDNQEKELENYWNGLRGNQTPENPVKSPVNPSSEIKNKSEQIKKLRQEIKELEKDSQINNNSEKQKELTEKKKRLSELEKLSDTKSSKSSHDLVLCLGLGIVIILIGGIMAHWLYRRKKTKK